MNAAHGDSEDLKKLVARDVVHLLANLSIAKIMKATGFSPCCASLVRKGEYVPHPDHVPALAMVAGFPNDYWDQNPWSGVAA